MARKIDDATTNLLTMRQVWAAGVGVLNDGGGLQLRVTAKSANWVFRFTSPSGRRREAGLGVAIRSSPETAGESLKTARKAAAKARALLSEGIDPLQVKDANREAAKATEQAQREEKQRERWTLARCARDYHERVIERSRSEVHARHWIQSLENHMPPSVWNMPVADVKPVELLQALEGVKAHERARRAGDLSETVRRMRQRLDAIYEDAIFYERATTNPAAAIKRKLGESRPVDEKQHLAALDYRQIPALMHRIRGLEGNGPKALEFAALCAARTTEVLLAEWAEFDLEARTWTLPGTRMKGRETHVVYLSDRAVELVRGQIGKDARWIFPSPQPERAGQPMSNATLLAVLGRLGVRAQTTAHGLCRAGFSTWANETGAGRPDVIEACLAHREQDMVRKSYNRATFADERRALLAAWSNYLSKPVALALAA